MSGRIVIAGAGSIGCFVGGLLALGGEEVVLLARSRIAEEIGLHGLTLTSFEEKRPGQYQFTHDVTVEIEGEDKPALQASWIGQVFA